MDPLTLILTLVFGTVTVFGGIGTYLFLRDRAKAKRESKELRERLQNIEKSQRQVAVYIDGLAETKGRKKIRFLNEALQARDEYRYEKAIQKFQEAYPLAEDDSERCAILNLIGTSQINSNAFRDAEQTFIEMIRIAKAAQLFEAFAAGYGNIGIIYRILGKPKKALRGFNNEVQHLGKREGFRYPKDVCTRNTII
jgi:tetratricopeptide (TPR) repeat protein